MLLYTYDAKLKKSHMYVGMCECVCVCLLYHPFMSVALFVKEENYSSIFLFLFLFFLIGKFKRNLSFVLS